MSQHLFPSNDEVIVPTNLLNNAWQIIRSEKAITPHQHRDLQNIFSLIRREADFYKTYGK